MRVLHYHKAIDLEAGGVVRAVLDICTALAQRGVDVVMASADTRDVPEEWKTGASDVPEVIGVEPPARRGGRFTNAQLDAMAPMVEAADVLNLHGVWAPFNIQLARLAQRVGTPYVASVHGMLDDWSMAQKTLKKRLFLSLCGTKYLHEAAAVHCTAEFELEQSRKWFPRGRGVVVPLVLDIGPFETLPGPQPARDRFDFLGDGRPVLLFLSRLHYKKGVEHLLRAAAELRDRNPIVVVAGTGDDAYKAQLEGLVTQLGIEENVVFPGFVAGIEKVSLYEASDVFVLPTSQENFGFVLFEALAARTPVVTTRGTDTWPEMEASGGSIISETTPAALAASIATILDDESRRTEMGESGRRWVLDNLGPDATAHRFEQLYQEVSAR